jgi:hypothetical protein
VLMWRCRDPHGGWRSSLPNSHPYFGRSIVTSSRSPTPDKAMKSMSPITALFPAFQRLVESTPALANPKGSLAAKLPRILGQGQTRAEGLKLPPAQIERQQELVSLSLPDGIAFDRDVQQEIASAAKAVEQHKEHVRHPEQRRRLALEVLHNLEGVKTGVKDNHFFAGRLILVPDKSGQNWSWSMTPHYAVISKIPADVEYVVAAYQAAEQIVDEWTLPVDRFLDRLKLAWSIARHFSSNDDVLIGDVARVFKIAGQGERFWGTPARRNFEDMPDAVFIANLINWRRNRDPGALRDSFELVPATLNQAHGTKSKAFYVPSNAEGTVVRPMIYMRRVVN